MRKSSTFDVLLWLGLAAMWSSSYAVIKIGLGTVDPIVLVFGRMLTGSVLIYSVLNLSGQSLSRKRRDWVSYALTGLLGSALPFLLITYGEQTVESALASILMGVMPVMTLALAAWALPDEPLSARAVIGVLGGLCGVTVLVGPTALAGLGAQLWAQLAIVGATLCYALSTVYVRRYVSRPPLEMATGSMIVGTVFVGGLAVATGADFSSVKPTLPSLGTVLYLGLFSTACANLIYFYLVPRLGATRMSQVNFAVPVGGALLGMMILGEALTPQRLIALIIIVTSVYLGTTKQRPKRKHPVTAHT